jgi:glycosyltransferase involved in cell wall biosynthesis
MKVSLIIPVYRVSAYLERCLMSVMNQDVEDIECLLIDDSSDDDSIHQAKALLTGYEGPLTFRCLRHPANRGLSAARNTGVEAAKGEYLFFLDGDDALTPGALNALLRTAASHPNVDIVQGNTLVEADSTLINSHSKPALNVDRLQYSLGRDLPAFTTQQPWLVNALLERKKIPVTSWNKLIRRSWFIENGLWFTEGLLHEDELWVFLAAANVSSLAFCRDITYVHYLRGGSIMRSQVDKSILSWFEIIKHMVDHLEVPPVALRRKVVLEVAFCNLVRIIKQGSQEEVAERLKHQRQLLQPLIDHPHPSNKLLEQWLLSWFNYPAWLLNILCRKHLKGLYLRSLSCYNT